MNGFFFAFPKYPTVNITFCNEEEIRVTFLLPSFRHFFPSYNLHFPPLFKPVKVYLCLLNKGKQLGLPRVLPFAGHWATKGKKEKKENLFLRISCLMAKVTCRSEQNAVIVAVIAMKTGENVLDSVSRSLVVGCKSREVVRHRACTRYTIANVDISCCCC